MEYFTYICIHINLKIYIMGFIISSEGFLVGSENKEKIKDGQRIGMETIYIWSDILLGATSFTSKQAKLIISKLEHGGFYWSPKREYPLRNKWEVVQRKVGVDFCSDENHLVGEYYPRRIRMQSNSDLSFLMSGKVLEGMSESDAIVESREKNIKVLHELVSKMDEQENRRVLRYDEKIKWFIQHYYESGMEYELLLVGMENEDLDNFVWHGDKIEFPVYVRDLKRLD